uniref:Uncharacterized protein n=1 Tax=Romanomermis culicivorax TaxID=13658 RepID=A0A915L072_ROMCU
MARQAAVEAALLLIEAKIDETPSTGGLKERKRKKAPAAPPTIKSENPDNKGGVVSKNDDNVELQVEPAAKRPC